MSLTSQIVLSWVLCNLLTMNSLPTDNLPTAALGYPLLRSTKADVNTNISPERRKLHNVSWASQQIALIA
jgi:hypothetical protein